MSCSCCAPDHYILAEFVPLAQIRGLPRLLTLELSQNLLTDESIEVAWVDDQLHGQALELLHARKDKTYSLRDAVSFLLMRDHNISDALTTDKHFE
jgi:predicted nucleic acid-binding protein